MKALKLGYHILLEKPMSSEPLEALEMAEEAEKHNRILIVCHSMRYSSYFRTLKELINLGKIGNIMTIQWTENVGVLHHAHSFVRGNWRNSDTSSPMILQKSCHDLDMLQWLIGDKCESISSFGDLSFFKEENAPKGSTERCMDGCAVEHECQFSALKEYLNEKDGWPQSVVSLDNRLEARVKALKEGPYGRCVYRCDNNVVDHQVVNLRFKNKVTVSFTMTAFTTENTRTFKIMGTKGEICGHNVKNEIQINYFSGKKEVIYPEIVDGGHGGADTNIMRDFIKHVATEDPNGGSSTGIESARTHLVAFAAEQSRITGKTVYLEDYIREL
jgi:predicted dehydrogenase